MKEQISNRTSIGNTNNPHLRVVSLVAALSIPPKTKDMAEEHNKFSSKKELSMPKSNDFNNTAADEFLL